jgi:hypothetical protein
MKLNGNLQQGRNAFRDADSECGMCEKNKTARHCILGLLDLLITDFQQRKCKQRAANQEQTDPFPTHKFQRSALNFQSSPFKTPCRIAKLRTGRGMRAIFCPVNHYLN